jgi:predicted phage terminase large subunit-like protein
MSLLTMPVNMSKADPFSAAEIEYNKKRYEVLKEVIKEKARRKHLNFIDYMWNNPSEPFVIGRHTRLICEKIDQAIERLKKNHSTFLVIVVPFRHGKAFSVDTPVLTVTGWKKHGELKKGDYVFDPMGRPVEVLATTGTYLHKRYVIEFEHGETLYTTPEHEWPVEYYDSKEKETYNIGIMETRQLKWAFAKENKKKISVIIRRHVESMELAKNNNGINYKTHARMKNLYRMRGNYSCNCIQVEGGLYLVGKGLIPTHNSEIISRKLPAHFLGIFPDGKVLLTGHTASLTVSFSKESRNLLLREKYKELFPESVLAPLDSAASHWRLYGRSGEVFACGLGGSMAGQGYTLGIVDDYFRNRADAESMKKRDVIWNAFTNDFLTRRAPRSITILTATAWHIDDVIGRIEKEMQIDPFFPKFEIIRIPAFDDEYEQGILFPERFNRQWYDEQQAALGTYGTASLLQCRPTAQGGNILKVDNVKKVPLTQFPNVKYARIWDLAHTEKERTSQDPDWTSGTLLFFRRKPGAPRQYEAWIKDVKRFRLDAPKRDNQILNITAADGPYTETAIENSIDSKDAFKTLQNLLLGQRIVKSVKLKGDKVVRAAPLEPIFEAGDVYVPEGATWLQAWIDELQSFPSGVHDDQVDNLSAGYAHFYQSSGVISVSYYEGGNSVQQQSTYR